MTITVEDLHRQLDVLEAKLDNTPCGRGWVGTKPPGCKRAGKAGATATKAEPKAKATKATKGRSAKGKAAPTEQPEQSSALTFAGKRQEQGQETPPKGKKAKGSVTDPQAEIDMKWASANPSDADVAGWLKDTALQATSPDKKEIGVSVLEGLKKEYGFYNGDDRKKNQKIKSPKKWAETVYEEEQARSKQRGREYKPEDFGLGGFGTVSTEEALKRLQKKMNNPKASSEAREKAAKQYAKLEKQSKEDRELGEKLAAKENARIKMTKEQRVAELMDRFNKEVNTEADRRKAAQDKIKKGDRAAIEDATRSFLVKTGEYFPPQGAKGYAKRNTEAVNEGARAYLASTFKKNGGDASTLGIDPKQTLTQSELKSAYRKAAAKAHPDRGGSAEQFRQVNEAYERMRQSARKDAIRVMHEKLDTLELQLELRKHGRLYKRGKVGT